MTRTRHGCKLTIVRGPGVLVLEHDSQRSTCSVSLINTAHNLRLIILNTWSCTLGTALTTKDILLKILN